MNDSTIKGRWYLRGIEEEPYQGSFDLDSFILTIWIPQSRSIDEIFLSLGDQETTTVPSTIVGQDSNQSFVTLFGCGLNNYNVSAGATEWTIGALAGVKGLHLQSWTEATARAVVIRPPLLSRWFNRRLMTPHQTADGRHTFSTTERMDFALPLEDGISIRFCDGVSNSSNLDELKWTHDSQIWFHFDEPKSLAEMTDRWIPWITRLLGLFMGCTVDAGEISIFQIDPYENDGNPFETEGKLIRTIRSNNRPNQRDVHPQNLLVPFEQVRDRLEPILSRWNQMSTRFEPTIALFSALSFHHTLYLEARFLFIVQAFEIYHKCSENYSSTELPRLEFRARIREAREALPPHLLDWATGKLSMNAKSLRHKLLDIFNEHEDVCLRLFDDLERVASEIAYTRNFLTHHNDNPDRERLIDDRNLSMISASLEALLWAILLRDLGAHEASIDRAIRRAEDLHFISLT